MPLEKLAHERRAPIALEAGPTANDRAAERAGPLALEPLAHTLLAEDVLAAQDHRAVEVVVADRARLICAFRHVRLCRISAIELRAER